MNFGPHSDYTYGRGIYHLDGYYRTWQRRVDPGCEYNNLDRAWRKEFKKSTYFTELEQKRFNSIQRTYYDFPEFYKARYNIFRRMERAPLNVLEHKILPKLGVPPLHATHIRMFIPVTAAVLAAAWATTYYFRYRSTKWESCKGWKVFTAKPEQHPGSKFYPQMTDFQKTQKKDYNVQDFNEEIHRRACKPSTPVVPYANANANDSATERLDKLYPERFGTVSS